VTDVLEMIVTDCWGEASNGTYEGAGEKEGMSAIATRRAKTPKPSAKTKSSVLKTHVRSHLAQL